MRPTRKLRADHPRAPPYLVLLRAGFSLPLALRRARCALTAPFHPYSPSPLRAPAERYVFCATFLRVTPTGNYPAHRPSEFGLSSPPIRRNRWARRSSGRLRRNVKEHYQTGLRPEPPRPLRGDPECPTPRPPGAPCAPSPTRSRCQRALTRRGCAPSPRSALAGPLLPTPGCASPVTLLRDIVLLELLIKVTTGRVDLFRRLGDVPP